MEGGVCGVESHHKHHHSRSQTCFSDKPQVYRLKQLGPFSYQFIPDNKINRGTLNILQRQNFTSSGFLSGGGGREPRLTFKSSSMQRWQITVNYCNQRKLQYSCKYRQCWHYIHERLQVGLEGAQMNNPLLRSNRPKCHLVILASQHVDVPHDFVVIKSRKLKLTY